MLETVSNFVDAKYGTVSWRNGLKFRGLEIWDRFDFCHDMHETVSNSAAAKYWTLSIFVLTCTPDMLELVSNLADAKYGTITIFVLT